MLIRNIDLVELKDAVNLIENVFRKYECFDYSEKGINNFENFINLDNMINKVSNGEIVFTGSFEEDKLTGVLAYYPKRNHICLFFVDYDYQGHGMGKALMQNYLEDCKLKGVNLITVNSSPFAVEIYKKYGFETTGEAKEEDGITYTPMDYILANKALGTIVTVIVDNPIGTVHSFLPDTIYTINSGFINDLVDTDGDLQDAYIFGVDEPIEQFTGTVIAIIHRANENDTKWVVAKSAQYNKQDVIDAVGFIEQHYDTSLEWL